MFGFSVDRLILARSDRQPQQYRGRPVLQPYFAARPPGTAMAGRVWPSRNLPKTPAPVEK